MRDDQRPFGHDHQDEEEERFDDALDELFGPDEDDQETRPRPSVQQPQPAAGSTPPSRAYEPDTHHHQMDDEHVIGVENEPPPASYTVVDEVPEAATSFSTAIAPERVVGPAESGRVTRDWRRIACFSCLAVVGIPALCLLALIILGIFADTDSDATPTVSGFFVDNTPTPDPTQAAGGPAQPVETGSLNERGEPFSTIMDGREQLGIEVDGAVGIGRLNSPVPVTVAAPLGDGWTLQINSVIPFANQIIADANRFNKPPASDRQFVMANVTATNSTGDPGTFDASFRLRLVGVSTGILYTTFEDPDRCRVVPDDYRDIEIAPGESASGNVCWQVRIEDVNNLILYSENFSEDEGAIWFNLTLDGSTS